MEHTEKQAEKYWAARAKHYNDLKWVKNRTYLEEFISAGHFTKKDLVLDVGTGTGIIARSLAPLVREVIGLDISQDMLEHSNWKDNKYFIKRDIRDPIFKDNVFDKITARMVFHHIVGDTQDAMDECYRLLKRGGKLIIGEGIPPCKEVKDDFEKIFKLKEDRLVFLEEDLADMMKKSGFKNITPKIYPMHNFSVKNWLKNSGLPKETQDKIFDMHVNGSDAFKKAYNLRIREDDCIIDTKNLIIVGEK